ncbi:MAG TPA: thioredoxin domain-containing protein [Gemmatimonadaceae bacterium]|jgi:protein-disulfide isomerase|nr:thioredoxin domain-containing protein [Gemmatimonadaceae bacterium]
MFPSDILFGGPPLSDPVDGADHVRGAASSLVTLVEYADFECLNCARAFPQLVRYLEEFKGTLRFVFRHYPLTWEHPASSLAARAAEAAERQGKFWEMHDELFRNPGMLHREALLAHAASAGLDIVLFSADLEDQSLVARIERDVESGRRSSIRATPTFFLDGARYANSRNLEGLRDAIMETAMRATTRYLREQAP